MLGGVLNAPVRSVKFFVFPAALPWYGRPWLLQTWYWSAGTVCFWMYWGDSMMVAKKPAMRCQSMWQCMAQTRARKVSLRDDYCERKYIDWGRERLIWIVCSEAVDEVAAFVDFHDIAADGGGRRIFGLAAVGTYVDAGTLDLREFCGISIDLYGFSD